MFWCAAMHVLSAGLQNKLRSSDVWSATAILQLEWIEFHNLSIVGSVLQCVSLVKEKTSSSPVVCLKVEILGCESALCLNSSVWTYDHVLFSCSWKNGIQRHRELQCLSLSTRWLKFTFRRSIQCVNLHGLSPHFTGWILFFCFFCCWLLLSESTSSYVLIFIYHQSA